jgi:hypothetical protein
MNNIFSKMIKFFNIKSCSGKKITKKNISYKSLDNTENETLCEISHHIENEVSNLFLGMNIYRYNGHDIQKQKIAEYVSESLSGIPDIKSIKNKSVINNAIINKVIINIQKAIDVISESKKTCGNECYHYDDLGELCELNKKMEKLKNEEMAKQTIIEGNSTFYCVYIEENQVLEYNYNI